MAFDRVRLSPLITLTVVALQIGVGRAQEIRITDAPPSADRFEPVQWTIETAGLRLENPFRDVTITGRFWTPGGASGAPPTIVEGFADATDGSLYRLRFLPRQAGWHRYTIDVRAAGQAPCELSRSGQFFVRPSERTGPVRIDPDHPWHFVREGSQTHYFWNGTTTYWLLGWQDPQIIHAILDRLARLKVNRIRVALCGRTTSGARWDEPLVAPTDQFQFRLEPFAAARPTNIEDPGLDVARYNVPFWQKCDDLVSYANRLGIVVSIIFYLDGRDPGVDPFGKQLAGGDDEQRYYRYGLARLASHPNVMWDVTNEYHLFRDEAWTEKMGALIKRFDPYQHLTSVHGHGEFRFRTSRWADFALFQSWDEHGGYEFMLKNRRQQQEAGRPMPQINEEYGYEDHYPGRWGEGRKPPARSGDNRRRLAWQMVMAGGYQTTGERADQGTGKGADTGGGWINGRGDDTMTMLLGYSYIRAFFESCDWWTLEPAPECVASEAKVYALAAPGGRLRVLYFARGGGATFHWPTDQAPRSLTLRWFNPRSGEWLPTVQVDGAATASLAAPGDDDWALVCLTD